MAAGFTTLVEQFIDHSHGRPIQLRASILWEETCGARVLVHGRRPLDGYEVCAAADFFQRRLRLAGCFKRPATSSQKSKVRSLRN
jgi:hypothetical protein